ncbi:hypothetical protein BOTBODRAFT_179805 [Botryobasidium botryosum FD-172 SS1]|uniref:Fascin domain-containing protein n=1 Tax=Botryobasidium botryosum (strain FD-172 SS1) TaxID=930990 RepID=A0A067M9B3_BOTB1|nr:hypothetical protein BOTBODRAFT_179805 [Botryobasidium botryosum FD-172 SS1]
MSLGNGTYLIQSKANGAPIGRHPVEDKSLIPKEVFALPQNAINIMDGRQPEWTLQKLEGGKYRLTIGNTSTGVVNGGVRGIFFDHSEAAEWSVESVGNELYEVSFDGKFWTLASDSADDFRGPKVLVGEKQGDASLFRFIRVARGN